MGRAKNGAHSTRPFSILVLVRWSISDQDNDSLEKIRTEMRISLNMHNGETEFVLSCA